MPKSVESSRYNLGKFIQNNRRGLGLGAAVLTTAACKASEVVSKWAELPLGAKIPLGLLTIAIIIGGTLWAGNIGNSIGDGVNNMVESTKLMPKSKPLNTAEKYMRQQGHNGWTPPQHGK